MSNRRRPTETRTFVPYVEGTDFDQEGCAVVAWNDEAGARQGMILPRSLSRLAGEPRAEARELQKLGVELQRIADEIDDQVMRCRDAGVSWSGIGWCLGTTGEASRQRWGL